MKIYEKAVENRKTLVDRLTELTGQEAAYTRMPRCAYEIGLFTVEKDGRLLANDGAELGIITILQHEGLIGNPITDEIEHTGQQEQQQNEPQAEGEEQPQTEESVERPTTIIPVGTKFRYNSETQRIEVADWDAPEDNDENIEDELPAIPDEEEIPDVANESEDEETQCDGAASEVSNQQGIELQLHAGGENEMELNEQSIEEATPANLDTSEPAEIMSHEQPEINTGALEPDNEITAEENVTEASEEGQEGINGIDLILEVAPEPSNEQGTESTELSENEATAEPQVASLDTSEAELPAPPALPAPEEINTGVYEPNNESD